MKMKKDSTLEQEKPTTEAERLERAKKKYDERAEKAAKALKEIKQRQLIVGRKLASITQKREEKERTKALIEIGAGFIANVWPEIDEKKQTIELLKKNLTGKRLEQREKAIALMLSSF